ncbi:MAG: flagellar biosynthesis anti-sigma factor FlgM [Clostridiales bacterium]|nr:flagellar biosynthesis anti-sigma factor FlgM [Clostridiales bacterium]
MKINPSQIAKAMEVYKAQKPSAIQSKRNDGQRKDELVLSGQAQAFQLALKALQKDEGVDLAKVERIKAQIEKGQYKVSSQDIADKIVDGILSKQRV